MPHTLYLHSGLTQNRTAARNDRERSSLLRFSNREVVAALGFAGLVNLAMVMMSSSVFGKSTSGITDLGVAYHALIPALGIAAAGVFLVGLMASGISSSTVGTMAGQVIMQGFVGFTIPIWLRRLVTMIPAVIVAAIGLNPTSTLVISQVVLSFVLPLPVITLVMFTRRRDLMGTLVNKAITTWAAIACSIVILSL